MTRLSEEYTAYCATHGTPDRIELMLCDLNAVLRGKWLRGDDLVKLEKGDVRLPLSTYVPNIFGSEVEATGIGSVVNDPDGFLEGVAGTLSRATWHSDHVAQMLVEMRAEKTGPISTLSSRKILQSVLDRFDANGLHPVVATELEFYLYQPRENPSDAPVPPGFSPGTQNYDLEVMARREKILTEIVEASSAQGIATDTIIAEYGPGQFEVNFHHTNNVLHAADTVIFFRRLVRAVAEKHGLAATFMAKPYREHPGNGMHAHISILDNDGQNIFDANSDEASVKLRSAVAGCLETMRDLQAIFAPHLNSYRRFMPGGFAPNSPDWGYDNRNAGIRLPEIKGPAARLEHRICGADVNPYLALAGILGGIDLGLAQKLQAPRNLEDPKSTPAKSLDHDWRRAVERFAQSDIAAEIYGQEYREIYAIGRRDEIDQIVSEITPAEYEFYLSRF